MDSIYRFCSNEKINPNKIKNLIINLTFKYIDLISSNGVSKKYFDEMKAINESQFNDYTPRGLKFSLSFGSNIFDRF